MIKISSLIAASLLVANWFTPEASARTVTMDLTGGHRPPKRITIDDDDLLKILVAEKKYDEYQWLFNDAHKSDRKKVLSMISSVFNDAEKSKHLPKSLREAGVREFQFTPNEMKKEEFERLSFIYGRLDQIKDVIDSESGEIDWQ